MSAAEIIDLSHARRPFDHYQTPPALAAAAIQALPETHPRIIVDLGAGDGVWGVAARARWPRAQIIGAELRDVEPHPAYDWWVTGDALTRPLGHAGVDLVIGNLPYDQAAAFVRRAHEIATFDGMVALLLRLSFAEPTRDRADLLTQHPIWRMLVVEGRPRFDPDRKGSDSAAPALFIWRRMTSPTHQPIGALRWKGGAR